MREKKGQKRGDAADMLEGDLYKRWGNIQAAAGVAINNGEHDQLELSQP